KGKSETATALKIASEFIYESMLVSAYDIYYGYLPLGKRFEIYPQITFLDSGGYETSDYFDFSSSFKHQINPKKWTIEMLAEVYTKWSDLHPAVLVNFDHVDRRISIKQQIGEARKFFSDFPKHLHCILLKPETKKQNYLPLKAV